MTDHDAQPSRSATVSAVLHGGPADIPAGLRVQRGVASGHPAIKIPHRGGYEHFEFQQDGTAPSVPDLAPPVVVYRWTGRTEMAE
jgi:uncharacterized protein DUF5988